jgi:hypothetical protein
MRDFVRGMRQGALVALVGVALGAAKALLHRLRYPTPLPTAAAGEVIAIMVAVLVIGGGVSSVFRGLMRRKMDVRIRRD